jgi:branched-chain amino acid transport system permease protein
MSAGAILVQLLNGLASASSLFLVAAGLSLIFGVTRIVNFAHGSLYMLGMYVALWLQEPLGRGALAFWGGALLAGLIVALLGAIIERLLLARIYAAPELLQLLATFALVLVIKDFALWAWGPEDMLGPRAPGLAGAVTIAGRSFPEYDVFLILLGPAVLLVLHLLLRHTRWGILVRAATEDREMASALGVNQRMLFTAVFALGALLAGLGGALAIPREPANLGIDLALIADAFVVVVVGGLGSVGGAFLAALLVGVVKALCIALGDVSLGGTVLSFSKLTLVIEFIIMAIVLVLRPWGLRGRMPALARGPAAIAPVLRLPSRGALAALALFCCALALVPLATRGYALVLLADMLVFGLLAVSLHFLMGPGGLTSFGHAAYFGLGAYGAGLLVLKTGLPMELALVLAPFVAALGALAFGSVGVRLSGVYLAMLTLAFAQIVWSIAFQWDSFTGGSNGLIGVWPAPWLASKAAWYLLTLASCALAIAMLWRMIFSPFGYALRAGRDSPLRADATGIHVMRHQQAAFVIAGLAAGLAGALFVFAKGSTSPEVLAIPRSVDALVMVLLGGLETLTGPLWGAAIFTYLQDAIARSIDYWRAVLGAIILVLVLASPQGFAGLVRALPWWRRG